MTAPVKIPSDVDRPDRLLGPLTGRQLIICGGSFVVLYLIWLGTRAVIPPLVYAVFAIPAAGAAIALALARRDAVSLDQYALAGLRHRAATRSGLRELRSAGDAGEASDPDTRIPSWVSGQASTRRALAGRVPTSPSRAPARTITRAGVINTHDGHAVAAVASPVNFALRSPEEQQAVTATFAGWLHSLNAPVQILIRALSVDLTGQITSLRHAAGDLAHPALTAAAHDHATYLAHLAEHYELLRHQVLIIFHEPAHATAIPGQAAERRGGSKASDKSAETRLAHRLAEATELLNPAGITLTPLRADQATAVLAAATHPDRLTPSHAMAHPGAAITHTRAAAAPYPHTAPIQLGTSYPISTDPAAPGWDGHDEFDRFGGPVPENRSDHGHRLLTDDPDFDPEFGPGLDAYDAGEEAYDDPDQYPMEPADSYSDSRDGGDGFGDGVGADPAGELSEDRTDGAGPPGSNLDIGLDPDLAYGRGVERDRPRRRSHQVTPAAAGDDSPAPITGASQRRWRSQHTGPGPGIDAGMKADLEDDLDADADAEDALDGDIHGDTDDVDHDAAPGRPQPRGAGRAGLRGQWGWSR